MITDPDSTVLDEPDALERLIASPIRTAFTQRRHPERQPSVPKPTSFTEPCSKCRGGGKYIAPTGFTTKADCFACKGTGARTFKAPAEKRAKAKANAAARKARRLQEDIADFGRRNPDVIAWINRTTTFEFAVKMKEALQKWGDLTDNQLAACKRCINNSKR